MSSSDEHLGFRGKLTKQVGKLCVRIKTISGCVFICCLMLADRFLFPVQEGGKLVPAHSR